MDRVSKMRMPILKNEADEDESNDDRPKNLILPIKEMKKMTEDEDGSCR